MASLELQAYTKLQQIKQQTESQLMQAMAERKLLDVSVALSAPNILIPKDFNTPANGMLVLILGTLSIKSDLQERTEWRRQQQERLAARAAKQQQQLTDSNDSDDMSSSTGSNGTGAPQSFAYLYDKVRHYR